MTMAMFAGIARAAPFVIMPVIRWLAVPLRRVLPTGGRLAADSLLSNPLRTAATAVALTIGLSVVVVNSTMSASFMSTIEDQMDSASPATSPCRRRASRSSRAAGQVSRGRSQRDRGDAGGGHGRRRCGRCRSSCPASRTARTRGSRSASTRSSSRVDGTEFQDVSQRRRYAELAEGGVLLGSAYAKKADLERGDTLELRRARGQRTTRK